MLTQVKLHRWSLIDETDYANYERKTRSIVLIIVRTHDQSAEKNTFMSTHYIDLMQVSCRLFYYNCMLFVIQ
jgi:hypothetical protein